MIRTDSNKHTFYRNMLIAANKKSERRYFLKALFNGIRAVDTLPYKNKYTKEELETGVKLSNEVMDLLKKATPKEIMNLFPIEKEYNGKRWGEKDYFYTVNYLQGIDINKPLGDGIEDFVWNYYNWDIMNFHIIHDSYHRELEYFKDKQFRNELEEKTKKIEEVVKLIDESLSLIKNYNTEITELSEKIKGKSKLFNLISLIKLRKKVRVRNAHFVFINLLSDYKKEMLKEFASVEGWERYIEELEKVDRNNANKAIIIRNKILNGCY